LAAFEAALQAGAATGLVAFVATSRGAAVAGAGAATYALALFGGAWGWTEITEFHCYFFNDVCELGVTYLHEVLHNPDHALDMWVVIVLNGLVHLAKAQGYQGRFLAFGFVNGAFHQRDFNLAHVFIR